MAESVEHAAYELMHNICKHPHPGDHLPRIARDCPRCVSEALATARREERERCADVALGFIKILSTSDEGTAHYDNSTQLARDIADAIRALEEKK